MKHFKSHFFMLSAAALLFFSTPAFAGDINAGLDTADGSSKFSVKDSGDSEVVPAMQGVDGKYCRTHGAISQYCRLSEFEPLQ